MCQTEVYNRDLRRFLLNSFLFLVYSHQKGGKTHKKLTRLVDFLVKSKLIANHKWILIPHCYQLSTDYLFVGDNKNYHSNTKKKN